jgi:methyl-accepting chemotaxis protein
VSLLRRSSAPVATAPDPVAAELRSRRQSLAKAQTALEGYNGVRETMRSALGDQSCLDDLQDRLNSMSDHCLTGLGEGLVAMADGDLTVVVHPATTPLPAARGAQLGSLGETFNVMLGKAQGGLEAYNATRTSVATMIERISETAGQVAGASEEMSATTQETGAAIENIARLSSGVVADEVRKLAECSSVTVRETEAAFHGLAESITNVSVCIERMSTATGDVVGIAREAGDATAEVSAATEQSSAATQQIAASSDDLAQMASTLQGLVGTFRV